MNQLEEQGFAIIPSVLEPVSRAGRRGVLAMPEISNLARSARLIALLQPHLTDTPVPVRAIYFDKTADANWHVAWHQDLTLALRARIDVPGFGPWSTKDGVPHVQPPTEILAQMLTIRIHLDDADEANGALRVIPGSHRFGRLSAERILELRTRQPDFVCSVAARGAMLMRPLLLHASGRSSGRRHRRVLHIEYASFTLPAGLKWQEVIDPPTG
jgi:ectoine hydroxylase-related dioxygenase (phytanoyl-CoA dioxygenase family)